MADSLGQGGEVQSQWVRVRARLRAEYGDAAYRSWLRNMSLQGIEEGRAKIAVPTRFLRDWVAAHYADRIRALWNGENNTVIAVDILVSGIAPQAAAKRITVRQKIEPAINQVLADKDMIYRAVLNLLSNAVKYTPEGGTVTASTAIDASEKKIIVGIADTGVGIPLKDLPFVFDKFYRVEQNSGMAKGTGLGLALVKQVVETVHDGKVSVESVVGKGTTFRIEMSLC